MGHPHEVTPANWQLRQATEGDREFLRRLHAATMRVHVERLWGWDDNQQRELFERGFQPALTQIIQADGEDVGVLVVERSEHEIYLVNIGVLPAWQSHGIGSSIIQALIAEAEIASLPLTLRVFHVNDRARKLYESLGFEEVKADELHAYLRLEPACNG